MPEDPEITRSWKWKPGTVSEETFTSRLTPNRTQASTTLNVEVMLLLKTT
jgi:hypothetical protein